MNAELYLVTDPRTNSALYPQPRIKSVTHMADGSIVYTLENLYVGQTYHLNRSVRVP